jgi:hypothetical protein
MIVLGEWFKVEHLVSFENNGVTIYQYNCDNESIIAYNETLLDNIEVKV